MFEATLERRTAGGRAAIRISCQAHLFGNLGPRTACHRHPRCHAVSTHFLSVLTPSPPLSGDRSATAPSTDTYTPRRPVPALQTPKSLAWNLRNHAQAARPHCLRSIHLRQAHHKSHIARRWPHCPHSTAARGLAPAGLPDASRSAQLSDPGHAASVHATSSRSLVNDDLDPSPYTARLRGPFGEHEQPCRTVRATARTITTPPYRTLNKAHSSPTRTRMSATTANRRTEELEVTGTPIQCGATALPTGTMSCSSATAPRPLP